MPKKPAPVAESPSHKGPSPLPDPIGFLEVNGLLHEINRTLLHPLGVEMAVVDGSITVLDASDYTPNVRYSSAELHKGRAAFLQMMALWGYEAHMKRKAVLGYVVQEK